MANYVHPNSVPLDFNYASIYCTRNSRGKFNLLSGLYLKQTRPPVLIFPKIEEDLDFDLILIWVVEMI